VPILRTPGSRGEARRPGGGYSRRMSSHNRLDEQQRRTHRALANANRARLLKLLEAGRLDVTAITAAMGLHPNTVRAHLDVLVDAGLVERDKQPAGGPGRPAWLYGLPDRPARDVSDRDLATVLAAALRDATEQPAAAAERAGRPWGRRIVSGEHRPDPAAAIRRVVELLADQGFEPELRDEGTERPQVLLRHCPFADVARGYGDVVCSAHLGLIRGALEELDASVAADLRPFVEADLCVAELAVTVGA
jgi:predicted ArsR family transcriptional regulator